MNVDQKNNDLIESTNLIQFVRDPRLRHDPELTDRVEEILGGGDLAVMHFQNEHENADEELRLVDGRIEQLQQDAEKKRHFVERQDQQRLLC